MNKTYIELAKIIDRYEYVSIDVFDTLIVRYVHFPGDIFSLIPLLLGKEETRSFADFSEHRVDAEHAARRSAGLRGKEEITLDDIYTFLCRNSPLTEAQLKEAKRYEIELEKRLCKLSSLGEFLIEYFKKNPRKKVILASDMYLPLAVIEDIIRQNGLTFHNELLLSNETGKTKHSGELYEAVIEYFNVPAKNILHIGDNYFVDKVRAENKGLFACYMPAARSFFDRTAAWHDTNLFLTNTQNKILLNSRWVQRTGHQTMQAETCLNVIKNDKEDYWRAFGELVFAPLLLSLVIWLKQDMEKKGLRKIIFLARDGQVVKQAFDLLYKDEVDTDYLYASRRMLTLPFEVLSEKEIGNYFHYAFWGSPTAAEALSKLPGAELLRERLIELNVEINVPLNTARRRQLIKAVGENAGLIKQALSEERKTVKSYLRSKIATDKNTVIFDLGWRGTLQAAIAKADNRFRNHIFGYYFGTTVEAIEKLMVNELSYVSFSMHNSKPEHFRHGCQTYTDVIEFLFSADHASVETVIEKDGDFSPKFMPISDAEKRSQEIAKSIQDSALFAIESLKDEVGFPLLEKLNIPTNVLNDFFGFLDKPGKVAARHFAEVRIFSGIGDEIGIPLIEDTENGAPIYKKMSQSRWKSAFRATLSKSDRIKLRMAKWIGSKSPFLKNISMR
uniref:Predicted hydrolase, HAD superfamily n=1 Tax=Candidatus Kentrum sp. DK TaxID=2126562 RepID=A0A450SX41_9GAMM|nr:MAG: Predicted hydrolase, HAD superfamily [Candidatus Kentron sp. DK]